MRNKLLALFIPVFLLLAGCSAGLVGVNAPSEPPSGMVEAKEVDVNTKIPGRVIKILVKEGDTVKAGQLIAQIDSKDLIAKEKQLQAQIAAAKAQISLARVSTLLQDKSSSSSLELAHAKLAEAQAQADLMQKSYDRMQKLYEETAISKQQIDDITAKADTAQAMVAQARASVSAAEASRLQVQVGQENVVSAQAKYDQAIAALEEVQVNLAETQIKSPCNGTVTSLITDEGELVSSGMPLLTVTDYTDNWVNLKVPETKIQALVLHQKLEVSAQSIPGKTFAGEIIDINRKPNFATNRATNDRGEKDIISYNVKIRLNNPGLHPGSTVTAKLPESS